MKIVFLALSALLLTSCIANQASALDFMLGTWKRKDKNQYEVWEKENATAYKGYSYKMTDKQKVITETLAIQKIKQQFVLQATVPDQNEGKTIEFALHILPDSIFSFENPQHDFPKKIQYQKISPDQVKVSVIGDEDQRFSYIQIRQ